MNLDRFVPWWELERGLGRQDTRRPRARWQEDMLEALDPASPVRESSWMPKELEAAVVNPQPPEQPFLWTRSDGKAMIYPLRAHSFIGESESMKSWAAIHVALDAARKGKGVVYIDCETSLDIFAGRLAGMGVGRNVRRIAYVRPDEPLYVRDGRYGEYTSTPALVALEGVFNAWHAELVVIDGVTEIMAMHGWDSSDAGDVARYHRVLLRRWSGEVASLEVDHIAKGDFNGDPNFVRSALGSQHKRAGIDGASYLFTSILKGGRGGRSESLVKLVKDREGGVRASQLTDKGDMGTFVVDSSGEDGKLEVAFLAGTLSGGDEMDVADAILKFLKASPNGNKAIADKLHLDRYRVRSATKKLEDGGLIVRGMQDRWELVD